ncbi:MAG TPA: PqqD family protein [Blastocatellia bacterium]|nr:PqqD family protein [Blastocatellia bacterium]
MSVSFDQKLVVTEDTLINVIEGESVLLNLKSESYFGLDRVGTRMWAALTSADSIRAAYETLLNEYDVSADKLKEDLSELVGKLVAKGLVEARDVES